MRISAIVAQSENRVIGINNQLPWHLPLDLRHFKEVTLGKTILMGRKTYESIGKALPGRTNVVLTRDPLFSAPGCVVVRDIETALQAVTTDEVVVIGGALIYESLLPRVDYLYLTQVHTTLEGDAFFPELPAEEWREVSREQFAQDEKHLYAYTFVELERV